MSGRNSHQWSTLSKSSNYKFQNEARQNFLNHSTEKIKTDGISALK